MSVDICCFNYVLIQWCLNSIYILTFIKIYNRRERMTDDLLTCAILRCFYDATLSPYAKKDCKYQSRIE